MKIDLDPKRRDELGRTARLWLLGLVCATVGAVVVSRTGSVYTGTGAFLLTLAVLGPCLWLVEKHLRRRRG